MIIRILCFGDSNTWGCIPGTKFQRFSERERFPKLLQQKLGNRYEIIEEGLNSRTLASEYKRPNKEGRNGSTYFIPCLYSHEPLDLVILMLGTTELKEEFNYSPEEVGILLEKYYVEVISKTTSVFKKKSPKLLIICPPIIKEIKASERYKRGEEKARLLSSIYSRIAKANNYEFVDASKLDVGSDGVHMIKESHAKLAKILANKVKLIKL